MIYLLLFFISYILIGVFKNFALQRGLIDHPNHRSSHQISTPRGAGLMVIVLWLLFILSLYLKGLFDTIGFYILFPTIIILSIISYADDILDISAKLRILGHFSVAILAAYLLGTESLDLMFLNIANHYITTIAIILFLVWSINLFNFMDGIDAFAGVEACFVLGVGGILFHLYGAPHYAIASYALVSILFGFLVWNKPKAKIFMGDVGSAAIGLIIALLALIGQKYFHIPIILWLMLYLCFIYDATITLVRRIIKGDKWYEAHRLHAYQRLNQAGWSHSKIGLALIAINILISVFVYLAYKNSQWTLELVLGEILLLTIIYIKIEKIKPMYENKNNTI